MTSIGYTWRFGERHVLGASYFRLERDGFKTLERTIQLPLGLQFPIGVEVDSFLESEIYKVSYTWLFHTDPKVELGLGAGLFVTRLSAGIRESTIAGQPLAPVVFDESVTAPLPVFGGRLAYRATKKLTFTATTDLFLLDYEGYAGSLSDLQLYVSHQTFKHVGFAGGLNVQDLQLEIDDGDLFWDVDEEMTGLLFALTFLF